MYIGNIRTKIRKIIPLTEAITNILKPLPSTDEECLKLILLEDIHAAKHLAGIVQKCLEILLVQIEEEGKEQCQTKNL